MNKQETITPLKVDIIWNISLVCPWDCDICCVDAVHVTMRRGSIQVRTEGLTQVQQLTHEKGRVSIYDKVALDRQRKGLELELEGKYAVIDHLEGFSPKIDFSGGDPLVVSENMLVLDKASNRFGRTAITLTATGAGLAQYDVDAIAPLIGELNFTYDSTTNNNRPIEYSKGYLRKAALFAHRGVATRSECPLSTENISRSSLECSASTILAGLTTITLADFS